jgi:DNA-binding NarL/FixJ family response regulator
MSAVKALVAEDSAVLRDALADLIQDEPGLELVGVAIDAEEAIIMADVHQPEVAVLDVKMPGGGGSHAASGISRVSPATRILAFSAYEDRDSVD